MIAVLKKGTTKAQIEKLTVWLQSQGLDVQISQGRDHTLLGIIGDTLHLDAGVLSSMEMVESVRTITEPYRKCSRRNHPEDTVISVGNAHIGRGHFCLIAGPCSVENENQVLKIAQAVKAAGADILRGGAFKPRTSPYDFQGLGAPGISLLLKAKTAVGLPVVSEIMSIEALDLFADVDIIQVGARNMQNYDLLRELGRTKKPVLLKRGLSSTINELLMSAEYILAQGNPNVILCERGIRTFETAARNTLDLTAVPLLHELSHLPVIVDPSHATGKASLVPPMAMAAAACGADGIMVEVHNDPVHALCDGAQSLRPEAFAQLAAKVRRIHSISCAEEEV